MITLPDIPSRVQICIKSANRTVYCALVVSLIMWYDSNPFGWTIDQIHDTIQVKNLIIIDCN